MAEKQLEPFAFLSYTRFDDEYLDGRITRYCDKLANEVRAQTGKPFKIFVDRTDIKWGQKWKGRIEEGLDSSVFLLAILTPTYFQSYPCYQEYKKFLDREKELGRNDLIIPIHFIKCEELTNHNLCADPEWARDLSEREYRDWVAQGFRFSGERTVKYQKEVASQATVIKESLGDVQAPRVSEEEPEEKLPEEVAEEKADSTPRVTSSPAGEQRTGEPEEKPKSRFTKWERPPRDLIVDATDDTKYNSISGAINDARHGDRILIRPGIYDESLFINKRLRFQGDGNIHEIRLCRDLTESGLITTEAGDVEIVGITMELESGFAISPVPVIECKRGSLKIVDCEIRKGDIGVLANKDATVRLIDCHIEGMWYNGVLAKGARKVETIGCWIETIKRDGIKLDYCTSAKVVHSRISDCLGKPIVSEGGELEFYDNEIYGNGDNEIEYHEPEDLPF